MEITYVNKLGNNISLSSNPSSLRLYRIIGLDGLTNNIYSTKSYGQDGISITNTNLTERSISLEGKIITRDKEEAERLKEELIRIFNVKFGGVLYYKNISIECEVEIGPIFSQSDYGIIEFVIDLIAPNPYLLGEENGEEISTWIGGFSFKFSLPFSLKQRGETKRNIINKGHAKTPIKVYFKGPAYNPCIFNRTTGEFIKVNRELTSDDTLIINTEFGNKTVEIERNGIKTNAFNYIDLDSTFFSLSVGDNIIEYSTENQLVPQSVQIRYRSRYVGI